MINSSSSRVNTAIDKYPILGVRLTYGARGYCMSHSYPFHVALSTRQPITRRSPRITRLRFHRQKTTTGSVVDATGPIPKHARHEVDGRGGGTRYGLDGLDQPLGNEGPRTCHASNPVVGHPRIDRYSKSSWSTERNIYP